MDKLKRKLIANLQNYLRERMDFIASLPTMDPLWTAPFDIIDNLINPILDDIKDKNLNPLNKGPNLFLLFDGILRSEGIRAGGIAFEIKIFKNNFSEPDFIWLSEFKYNNNQVKYEIKINKQGDEAEFPIAISLGTSGCQAFYGIIENILRNSGRHSDKKEIKKVVNYSEAMEKNTLPGENDKPLKITIEFYYKWSDGYSYKDYQDDYIKVKIYDNMLGWQKKNNNWIKFDKKMTIDEIKILLSSEYKEFGKDANKKMQDGRIIDDTGNIIQGNWGFKEMRICASFLRGIKITDYEKKYKPPVITPIPIPDKKKKASLGFEFYIPKVKNLLIVSKNLSRKIKAEDLKNKGIYIEEDANKIIELQQGVFTHEFVAIDIDEEENKKFIQENSLLLPYKLFFITSQNNNLEKIVNLFKNVRYDLYIKNSVSSLEKENLKNLIISKKKNLIPWLTKNGIFEINNVKYKCSPAERVYLEIYKRWNSYLYLNKNPIMGICHKELATDLKNLIYFLNSSEINKIESLKNKLILLWHRFENYDAVFKKLKSYLISALPYTHGISFKITKIAEHFENAKNYEDKFAILNYLITLEIGATNIIIIDERVFNEANKIRNICGKNINFALSWYLQNVVIFNLDKGDKKIPFKLSGYLVNPEGELTQSFTKPDIINIKNISKYLPQHFQNKVHFMIIHQSIITKIGGKEKFKEFIKSLPEEYKPWYVVVTSGRGHPPKNEMPEKTKFLDFSTLRSVVIDHPDKFLLTKILTGLKEE